VIFIHNASPGHVVEMLSITHYSPGHDWKAIEAINGKNELQGLVLYDHFTPNSAQIHVYVVNPFGCLRLRREAFRYPFEMLQRNVLIGIVESQSKALKFALELGFREVGRVKDGFSDGSDSVILEMRKHECKWVTK
jgi:hypothetical protein